MAVCRCGTGVPGAGGARHDRARTRCGSGGACVRRPSRPGRPRAVRRWYRPAVARDAGGGCVRPLRLAVRSSASCCAEAMASGLPVIVSRVGGLVEYLTHRENALLCEPGQPGELATLLQEMIDDASLRGALGAGGACHRRAAFRRRCRCCRVSRTCFVQLETRVSARLVDSSGFWPDPVAGPWPVAAAGRFRAITLSSGQLSRSRCSDRHAGLPARRRA